MSASSPKTKYQTLPMPSIGVWRLQFLHQTNTKAAGKEANQLKTRNIILGIRRLEPTKSPKREKGFKGKTFNIVMKFAGHLICVFFSSSEFNPGTNGF
jgi:hypothetical protein